MLAHWRLQLGSVTVPSTDGFTIALWISVAACVVGVLVTFLIPRGRRGDGEDPREPTRHSPVSAPAS
ncbi:MAG: hypothetical protein ACRDPH_04155 [Marmoricola sp.]